jgi:hypothetical protein
MGKKGGFSARGGVTLLDVCATTLDVCRDVIRCLHDDIGLMDGFFRRGLRKAF